MDTTDCHRTDPEASRTRAVWPGTVPSHIHVVCKPREKNLCLSLQEAYSKKQGSKGGLSQSFFETSGLGPTVGLQNHSSTAVIQAAVWAGPFSAEGLTFLRICLSLPNSVLWWLLRVPVLISLHLEVGSLRSIEILWNIGGLNLDSWKERLWAFSLSFFFSFFFFFEVLNISEYFLVLFSSFFGKYFHSKSTFLTANNNANAEKWKQLK